ncbi:sodium/potassium/calcium exchanger zydeco [Arctopsyche grandis]|uniref:sodium/potassium/calcium exchanger zydeco n=1 Tax=Arctopsyche grandis TaxID=121162 RepID=UPI00406D6762
MSNDVAGATFMAAATSAPELFVNVIGTFITEGDIGVGTIVGSAVFNILAVAACCGLGAGMQVIPLDWWPLTRDCLAYGFTVSILICIIHDERVEWYEAMVLVILYVVYIAIMYFDKSFQRCAREAIEAQLPFQSSVRPEQGERQQPNGGVKWSGDHSDTSSVVKSHRNIKILSIQAAYIDQDIPTSPDVANNACDADREQLKSNDTQVQKNREDYDKIEVVGDNENTNQEVISTVQKSHDSENVNQDVEDEYEFSLLKWPKGRSWFTKVTWIITWPIHLIFTFTIPDCEKPRFKQWFPLTFLMCIIWIGSLSYLVAWMITIIGDTLKIPDSVMGITFLAAGTSVPEAVSSVIVAKQGHGSMGISNSIGSNTFDILLCLGLPWLIKAAFIPTEPGHHWVAINSAGLEYSAISLLSTLFMMYATFYCNKFRLDKRVGRVCLCMYAVFLVLATLIELNVLFQVNLPTCGR